MHTTQYPLVKCLAIGIVIISLLSSCSSKPDSLKLIPKETHVVSSANIYELAKKAKLQEIEEFEFFKVFQKEVQSENKKLYTVLEDFAKDPSSTGIDLTSDMFLYYLNQAKDQEFTCISLALNNSEDFSLFVKKLLDESKVDYEYSEESVYERIALDDDFVISWNEIAALLTIPQNYRSKKKVLESVEGFMTLKEDIYEDANFKAFYDNKKDVNLYLSSNFFYGNEEFVREKDEIEKELGVSFSDNFLNTYVDFSDDKISLSMKTSCNEQLQSLLDESYLNDAFNEELLKYIPLKSFITSSVQYNLKAMSKQRKETYDEASRELERKLGVMMDEVLSTFDGSVVYSLHDYNDYEYTYLGWGYGFNEEKATKLDELYPISRAGDLTEIEKTALNEGKTIQCNNSDGQYCINIKNILDNGGSVYTALQNDDLINWYEGGWDYGRYKEKVREDYLPVMSMAIGVKNKEKLENILDTLASTKIKDKGAYYEFSLFNRYPTYISYNNDVLLITNEMKAIEALNANENYQANIYQSSEKRDYVNGPFYTTINLNYEDYPTRLREEVSRGDKKVFEALDKFMQRFEIKTINDNEMEMILHIHDNGNNVLNHILTMIEENYKDFF